ncbi:HlyU family transcriptional regulator [Tateyamaria sp. SN6-1]|uniref:HlyU family transcriptional regulator n=1 Tax=Tateyamaria sp. SN6-1 TaxID=3092148 RepID=UPI0039F45C0D
MSLLKRLFGGGAPREVAVVEYNGYRITPTPIAEGPQYRLSATIERDVDGATKTHNLVRADTVSGLEAAETASVEKAQQVIDALGDGIFR